MNYYISIKNELINNEVYKKVKDYSKRLTNELGKGYNTSTLKSMRQFYLFCKKSQPLADQLTWSHYQELLPLKDINHNKTIGIILVKEDNKFIIKYASDNRIYSSKYILI